MRSLRKEFGGRDHHYPCAIYDREPGLYLLYSRWSSRNLWQWFMGDRAKRGIMGGDNE